MLSTADIVRRAAQAALAVPAFNVPYLPMVAPVIRAVVEADCLALIETARLEWTKFESSGPAAVMSEFRRWADPGQVRIHLDHVPVIDENGLQVHYLAILREAIGLGYQSVMVDGSRLDLEGNIEATRRAVELAHAAGIPCEAELGAVLGHEPGSRPDYDTLFETGLGFTGIDEARRFVQETGCDWLSVAVGNVHGAVSGALRDQRKVEARLDLDHLDRLRRATGVPLVLHGGSGIKRDTLLAAVRRGIAKVNVGTEIRQAYEAALRESGSETTAQQAVYERTGRLLRETFELAGTRQQLLGWARGEDSKQV